MQVDKKGFITHSENRIKEIQKDMLLNFWIYDVIKMETLAFKIQIIKKSISLFKIQIDKRFQITNLN